MPLTAKKVDYIFVEPLNLNIIVGELFFLFRSGFQEKIDLSWRNYLIWTVDWGGEHSNPGTQNTLIFFSSIAVMQVIFWTEDNFCLISDCRNSFNWKFKKLINEQIIIFYSPSNALCSSNKSVQIKHLRCVLPFHLVQPKNTEFLLMKTHLKQIEQMCVIVKTRVFYSFTFNSQSKLKKFSTLFLRHLPEKHATRFNKVSWWAFWVGDPRNIHNRFLWKTITWTRISISSTAERSPWKRKKNFFKVASHLKIAWHSKRQKKNIEKRERRKMRKSQQQ